MNTEAHVTSEWESGYVTIQVRTSTGRPGDVNTIGYTTTNQGGPKDVPLVVQEGIHGDRTVEALSEQYAHAPGIRMPHDTAVAIWEALEGYLHNTGQHPSRDLEKARAELEAATHTLELALAHGTAVEDLLAAERNHAAATRATLDRERAQHDANLKRLEWLETPRRLNLGANEVARDRSPARTTGGVATDATPPLPR